MKKLLFILLTAYSLQLTAQQNNHIFVNRGETTILRWQAPKDYTAYDSLYFAVKACTTNCGRLSTVSKSCTMSYSEPYTAIACTLYADNTAGLNAAKYYYSIYAYGADTLLVTNGNLNLQLNGQTVVDGVASVSPIYTIALSPPDHDTTFIIGYKADSTWDEVDVNTVRGLMSSIAATVPDSVIYPYELDTLYTKTSHIVNVKEFGAVGDSTTDDLAAIQAAINDASGGGTLIIPEGQYRVSAKIDLDGLSDITIRGSGKGSIIENAGNDFGAFDISNSHNIIFENFTIRGDFLTMLTNHDNQSGILCSQPGTTDSVYNITIQNMYFNNLAGDAINLNSNITNIKIINNTWEDGLGFVQLIGTVATPVDNVLIQGNTILGSVVSERGDPGSISGSDDIIDMWGTIKNINIVDNFLDARRSADDTTCVNHGVLILGVDNPLMGSFTNINVENNTFVNFHNNRQTPFGNTYYTVGAIEINSANAGADSSARNITIRNNKIYSDRGRSIFLYYPMSNVAVEGNQVYGGETGIHIVELPGSKSVLKTIKNNYFGEFSGKGIYLQGRNTLIQGNIVNLDSVGAGLYGIFVTTSDSNYIKGNIIEGGAATNRGLFIAASTYLAIEENIFRNISGTAVEFNTDVTTDNITFKNNLFLNNGTNLTNSNVQDIFALSEPVTDKYYADKYYTGTKGYLYGDDKEVYTTNEDGKITKLTHNLTQTTPYDVVGETDYARIQSDVLFDVLTDTVAIEDYLFETYTRRVLADGGTLIDTSAIRIFYQMAVDSGYVDSIAHASGTSYGVKFDADSNVTKLYDLSININDITQVDTTYSPDLELSQVNGYGTASFDGSNDYMQVQMDNLSQPETMFLIGKARGWTGSRHFIDGYNTQSGGILMLGSSPLIGIFSGGVSDGGQSITLNSFDLLTAVFNGGTSSIQVNDVAAESCSLGVEDMDGITLGRTAVAALWGAVDLSEQIILNVNASASLKTKIQTFLNNKYNVYAGYSSNTHTAHLPLVHLPDTTGVSSGLVPKYQGNGTIAWQSDATGAGGAAYTDSVTHDGRHVIGDSLITDAEGYARFIEFGDMNTLAEFDTLIGTTGTRSATTYLRGDNSWGTPAGGSGIDSVGADTSPTLGGNLELNDKNLINTTPTFVLTPTELEQLDAPDIPLDLVQDSLTTKLNRSELDIAPSKIQDSLTVKLNIANTSAWDKNASDDLTTGTSFSGDVTGNYNSTVVSNDSHTHNGTTLADSVVFTSEIAGDTSDYTITEMDSILNNAKMKWDSTASTGYATQYDLTQISVNGDTTHFVLFSKVIGLQDSIDALQAQIDALEVAGYPMQPFTDAYLALDTLGTDPNFPDSTSAAVSTVIASKIRFIDDTALDVGKISLITTSEYRYKAQGGSWSSWLTKSSVSYIKDLDSIQVRDTSSSSASTDILVRGWFAGVLDTFKITTIGDVTPPAKATSFVAAGGTSQTQYVSTWTNPSERIDSVHFYEGSANDSTTLVLVARVDSNTTYTRTGRSAGTTYWAAVKLKDVAGNISAFSNIDSAKTTSAGGGLSGQIFYTDFESGTLASIFDARSIPSPNTIALATDTVKNGSKSCKWTAGDDAGNPDFWTTISAPDVTKVYISFWIRYNDVTNASGTGTQKDYMVTLSDGAGGVAAGVRWIIDSNHLYSLGLRVEGTGETTLPPGIQEDVPFTWQHWEIRYSHGATDYFALKVDEDSVGAIPLVNQAGIFIDSIKIGLNLGNEGAENGYWYIDDIEVDSSLTRW